MTEPVIPSPDGAAERLLIEAAAREADALESGPASVGTRVRAASKDIHDWQDSFPGYQVIRELHRGGQGVVFQALHKGTKRKVAIKVMREGPFASPREHARFEREMQILGQLNDPRIVQIHDSNTAGGSSYYVMDYVSGHALDFYMASHRWSIHDTLRLFQKICEGVNAAHVRGVIHRDLKPSNIRIDSEGEPHILDFGLAKVVTGEFTDESQPRLMSMTGEFIGSLPWASPEQAEGIAAKIDIRTDVYALGVVLFQMLTGTFPYPVVGSMRTVMDNILKAEPTKPRSLRKDLDDDVQTIVLKCLAKERERRYQTAGELGRDVGHFLAGEPIEAKRDSGWYILRKTLAKYRARATVAGLFLLLVVAYSITMPILYRSAESARVKAAAAEQTTERALLFIVETLANADPEEEPRPGLTVREALDRAATAVRREFQDAPEVKIRLCNSIGGIFNHLGEYERAEGFLDTARDLGIRLFGEDDPHVAESFHILASVYTGTGRLREAEEAALKAVNIRRTIYGDPSAPLADSLNYLAVVLKDKRDFQGAENFFRQVLAMRRQVLPKVHRDVARSANNLAVLLRNRGSFEESELLFREALDIFTELRGPESFAVARVLGSLGQCMLDQRKYDEADKLLNRSLNLKLKVVSSESSIGNTEHLLGRLYYESDPSDLAKAENYCRLALDRRKKLNDVRGAQESQELLDRIIAARK